MASINFREVVVPMALTIIIMGAVIAFFWSILTGIGIGLIGLTVAIVNG